MAVINVACKGHKDYNITIKPDILKSVGDLVRPLTNAKRVSIISDTNVAPLYLKTVAESFKAAGFEVSTFAFEAGETSKTLETVNRIMECFLINKLTRTDIAVALGGGVTGDLTGFASAIYLRGIDFVQIPTSLLAQVDSSVGGKTGCDLAFGKNLCGAFHNPLGVFIDENVLKTLPKHFFIDGLAEAIKAGAIKLPHLFELFESGAENEISTVIYESIKMKADIVQKDFTEKGERTLLNFGHTIGHAIELYENYRGLSHGQAVAVGMAVITKAAEKAGLTESGTYNRLVDCLKAYSLPFETDIPLKAIAELALRDKKASGDKIKLVLIKNIGQGFVKEIDAQNLYDFLSEGVC